jgi:hypothetical protein
MVPAFPGLADLLAQPVRALLDVGDRVAALAVVYAEALRPRACRRHRGPPPGQRLANKIVADSAASDRIEIQLQDLQELEERDHFAMGWAPASFLPETALRNGIRAVARALMPGGWLLLGHGRVTGSPLERAITRFKTIGLRRNRTR